MAAEHACLCHFAHLVEILVVTRSCKRLGLDLQAALTEKQPDLLVWSKLGLSTERDTFAVWLVLVHYVLAGFEDAKRLVIFAGVLLRLLIRCHLCSIASLFYLC